MSKVLFPNLEEAVSQITPGDDRQLLLVKFKAKEHYCLADSDEAALAAVAREAGAQVGNVPLDMVLRAHEARLQKAAAKASPDLPKNPLPASLNLGSFSDEGLRDIIRKETTLPDPADMKRPELVKAIMGSLPGRYIDDKGEAAKKPGK